MELCYGTCRYHLYETYVQNTYGRTFVMHQPSDLFFSAQIPDFDNLISAPCGEPLPAIRGRGNGLDA